MEPNPLEATIEELIQKHRTGPLLLTMRQEQGTVWGKPKDDPVVGVRYLFFPRRVFGKVSQIWDVPNVCLARIGEFYLDQKDRSDLECLQWVPMQPAQWASRVSWWGNVTLGGLVAYKMESKGFFSAPFVEFAYEFYLFKNPNAGWEGVWLRRHDEMARRWRRAIASGDPDKAKSVMTSMGDYLEWVLTGLDKLWSESWERFESKLAKIQGKDVMGRPLNKQEWVDCGYWSWELNSFWYPRSIA